MDRGPAARKRHSDLREVIRRLSLYRSFLSLCYWRSFIRGSVAKFDFWGKIQKSGVRNSMTYRLTNSRKSNYATEPQIEPCAAHEFTVHEATQRERAKRRQHRHPPRAQPVAPLRECHGGRPRLTPRRGTDQAPHREQGHPGGRTREEKRPNRFKFLVMRGPPASPLFASWAWPRHTWMLVESC
jgi:hypothetical protein